MTVDETFRLALDYYRQGNLLQAESICTKILNVHPDNADVLHLAGIIQYELKNYDSAKKYIEASLKLDPTEAFAYFNLANIFRDEQKPDEAIINYQKALQIDPTLGDAYYNLGIIFEGKGQMDEALTCYGKAIQIDSSDAASYNNLGVVLQKKGQIDDAITCFEKALRIKPDNAKTCNNLGIALHDKKQYDEAINIYRRAVLLDSNLADAYNNLGKSLKEKGLLDEALSNYQKAIQLNPKYIEAYNNLGMVYKDKGLADEAICNYRKALQLRPDYSDAYNNLGIALQYKRQVEEAITCYRKALQINPNDAVTHWNLSLALLLSGNFKDGWREYEWRLKVKDFNFPKINRPLWNGSDISGRSILLHAEQGFGDTIQFIRYAPLVAQLGARVIVRCQKEVRTLIQDMQGIEQVVDYDKQPPDCDIYCPLLSLPFIFGTTPAGIPSDIPYVKINGILVQEWKNRIQKDYSKLKAGIVWSGREQRSLSLELFVPLLQTGGITFYSLQKGEAAKQAKNHYGDMKLVDYTEGITDFSDTAALIGNLDLIITVDTAVAHLAGALGKPVWTLLPFAPDWRWMLDREDSPWYPTMRLFRQPLSGDWESVINRVRQELCSIT